MARLVEDLARQISRLADWGGKADRHSRADRIWAHVGPACGRNLAARRGPEARWPTTKWTSGRARIRGPTRTRNRGRFRAKKHAGTNAEEFSAGAARLQIRVRCRESGKTPFSRWRMRAQGISPGASRASLICSCKGPRRLKRPQGGIGARNLTLAKRFGGDAWRRHQRASPGVGPRERIHH